MKTLTLGMFFLLWHASIVQAGTVSGPAPIASAAESIILTDAPTVPSATLAFRLAHSEAPLVLVNQSAASPASRPNSRAWKLSLLALAAAASADALSSWGKQEANPLLRSSNGTFGVRGLTIKGGLTGASVVPQYMMRNNSKARKTFTILNFAETAMFTALAVHNFSIPTVKAVK
jgi:hypothetical protein